MTKQLRRALAFVPVIVIATSAVALAGPVKGGTYTGSTAHGRAAITLKVSSSGKAVTVSVPSPPAYCQTASGPTRQITRAAAISNSGSFTGSISYEFQLVQKTVVKLFFSGRFSGRRVTGTARSDFIYGKECNGSTSFSARAR